MKVEETTYFRKIDSVGRITIPMKLRNTYNISDGDELQYHSIIDDDGNYYLALKVEEPSQEAEAEEVNRLLQEHGLTIDTLDGLLKQLNRK